MRAAVAASVAASVAATAVAFVGAAAADPIDDLTRAFARFRGIGAADVRAYTAPLTLPDEGEDSVALLEAWRAPAELALAAADNSTPRAIVRSWALFLEPMFVTRTSLLGMDLESGASRLRSVATIHSEPRAGDGPIIDVTLPDPADALLPDLLRDVAGLHAELDGRGRIQNLIVDLRLGANEAPERIQLACTYDASDGDLPRRAKWTLTDGRAVLVDTTFRIEAGRRASNSS